MKNIFSVSVLSCLFCGAAIIPISSGFAEESWLSYEDGVPSITVRRYPETPRSVPGVVHLLDKETIEIGRAHV